MFPVLALFFGFFLVSFAPAISAAGNSASPSPMVMASEDARAGASGSIPSTTDAMRDRIGEIQREIDDLVGRKDRILAEQSIEEEELHRVLVSLGSLQNAYSRYISSLETLEEARQDVETPDAGEANFVKLDPPPFNLSLYEEIRNRFESVDQRLNSLRSSVRLAEGTIVALEEQLSRAEEHRKAILEGYQGQDRNDYFKKNWQLKEVEADLETMKVSKMVQRVNIEARTMRLSLLEAEHAALRDSLDFIRKHLVFDEEDRAGRIRVLGEQVVAERERLVELRNEREKVRDALARSQGALTSARNERERLLARAGVAEQQAALRLSQVSLEQTEQRLAFLEEKQKIWDARYALIGETLKGQAIWDLRSSVLVRVKDLENAFLVRQSSMTEIQAEIVAAQKEMEEYTGNNSVLARIRSRIELLNRTAEVNNSAVSQMFTLFNQYSRLREEINDRIDTFRIAERVTEFGKERFLAFWNITLWSGDGFDVTIAKLILAVFLFLAAFFLSGRLTAFLSRTLLARFGMDSTARMASQKILFFILMAAFILGALDLVGIPLTAFAFLGGAIAIGIGFGAQNIFNNLISGFILMLSKPMRVEDTIEIDGMFATVQEIGARATRIKTFDNIDVLMPNSYFLNNKIVNWNLTDQKIRIRINVGVSYRSDVRKVEELLLLAANDHTRILRNPEPFVIFRDFGPSALDFTLFFWIDMTNASTVKVASDIRFRLVSLFEKNGITIAFPQMDVHLDVRTPVDLRMSRSRREDNNPTIQEE